jgi:hypothetical protein
MPREWDEWSDPEWLSNAGAYHGARLSAEAWGAMPAVKKGRALTSARTQLAVWSDHKNYAVAVFEQAAWLTTESAENAMNDYSSVSVGTGFVSVSYGRGARAGNRPSWMSPVAWALLGENLSSGRWSAGRII